MRPVLYFDLGSPYGWLALERAADVLGVEPELEPILLGGIFQRRGWGSWALTERRAEGIAEVERRAAAYGLPAVAWPPGWPGNMLAAMRAAVWAKGRGRGREFALAAYRLAFVEGADLADLAVLAEAARIAGLAGEGEVATAIQDPAVKAALRDATDAAWEAGVRGVPTVRVGADCFWGDDRLEEAAERLAG